LVINVVPDEPGVAPDVAAAAGVVVAAGGLEELLELAHAVTSSTEATKPTAHNTFRISHALLTPC
jgi:hypothetical protein